MFDDDDGIGGFGLLYGSLIVISLVCIILGCGALSIDWLRSAF
jgi:hypothetical protein